MIWLSQWLCPDRHCSSALAWDDEESTAEEMEAVGEELYTTGALKRWCGICGAELHVEHGKTAFSTMEEAQPFLEKCEAENNLARSLFGGKY